MAAETTRKLFHALRFSANYGMLGGLACNISGRRYFNKFLRISNSLMIIYQ